ncbi:MAG: hypothetical protein Q8N23_18760 [Archangium sp.]|nr:hypothetical protein [Archangium sp.]MDP3573617.1 hypothetical protein [Archangium sp.]
MRRAPWLFIVLALLPACSPPPPGCPRQLIDVTGAPNGGFAGGVGGSGGASAPLAVVGLPVSVTLFAPLSGCQGDSLRTDVTLIDPDNLPVTDLTVTAPRLNISSGVGTTVNFTPGKTGLYALRVSFEPSLGVRSLFIDVAADPLREAPVVRVPIPNGANCYTNALWPLSDDTVACEARGPGTVSISSADGGVQTFPGSHLVVADTVLWSIHPALRQLERRVWEDGGVRVTHVFANFAATLTPGMHDVDVALRYRPAGELARVKVQRDGGFSVEEFRADALGNPPEAFFVEPGDELFRWSEGPCFDSFNCSNAFSDLVAVEPGLVWRAELAFDGLASRVTASARPTSPAASTFVMTLTHRPEAPRFVTESFERVPLWLEQGVGNRRLLVTARDGGFELSAWPRSEVLRVGRHHLVLTDAQADFVRVIRR